MFIEEHDMVLFLMMLNGWVKVTEKGQPFKEECERGQRQSSEGLSVENKDKRVGPLRDGHFWEQWHSCV